MLDVMAELVGDDGGLREITRRAKALVQLLEETEIEIHLLIERAIKRPHRRLSLSAARRGTVAEQYHLGGAEIPTRTLERARPCALRVVEDEGDELHHRLLTRGVRGSQADFSAGCVLAGVGKDSWTEDQCENQSDDAAADSHRHAKATAATTAAIFKIRAAPARAPFHDDRLVCGCETVSRYSSKNSARGDGAGSHP